MVVAAVFHGDPAERHALLMCVNRYCTCGPTTRGHCPAHQALLEQRFLDGLLFVRTLTEQLLTEEFRR